MNVMIERARAAAEELRGTAQSISDVATDTEMNDLTFCRTLDAHVLCCSGCGWWIGTDEADTDSGDVFCTDCVNSEGST